MGWLSLLWKGGSKAARFAEEGGATLEKTTVGLVRTGAKAKTAMRASTAAQAEARAALKAGGLSKAQEKALLAELKQSTAATKESTAALEEEAAVGKYLAKKTPGFWQKLAVKGTVVGVPTVGLGCGGAWAWGKISTGVDNAMENGLIGSAAQLAVGRKNADKLGILADRALNKIDEVTRPDDGNSQQQQQEQQPAQPQYVGVDANGNPVYSPAIGMNQSIGQAGNGMMGMFGNFFHNLFSGNVSMGSALQLLLGAWLLMGRFGMWGRIGGGLLSYLMVNKNSQPQLAPQPVVYQPQPQVQRENEPYLAPDANLTLGR